MQLQVKKLSTRATLPSRAYQFDSGLDLYSCLEKDEITLQPLERKLVGTGISVKLPAPEEIKVTDVYFFTTGTTLVYEGQVRSKSGLTLKQGLIVANSPGTVDNEYSGEIGVILLNLSNEPIIIKHGQKIAQFVVVPVVIPTVVEVTEVYSTTRKSAGFGSTGV